MAYAPIILADSPQGYWRMNETSGIVASDSSGNGYNAAISGATLSQPGALIGDSDTCMLFTAAGGLTLPYTLNPGLWAALTLEFWVNISSTWHYLAIATDASGTAYYLDSGITTPGSPIGASILVGTSILDFIGNVTSNQYLDEVAIYNYKFSSAQASKHYSAGIGIGSAVSYTVTISSKAVIVDQFSLQFSRSVGKHGDASFTVHTDSDTHFQDRQQVAIYDQTGTAVFTGYVKDPEETPEGYNDPLGFHGTLKQNITCTDQTWLASKRRVATTFANKTCGYMVQWLVDNILSQEGVTVGQIYDGLTPGPTLFPRIDLYPGGNVGLIPQAVFGYCKVSEALDALAKAASESGVPYYWMIGPLKDLWFVPYTTVVNSTIVDGTLQENIKVKRANPAYRNQQTVLGGVIQTVVLSRSFKGDNSATTWTLDYDVATVPTITVNGSAKTVGIGGVDTGKDFYWNKGDKVIKQADGATKLISTDTLAITYVGQYPNTVISQNAAQVAYQASIDGTSGIIEEITNDNTLNDVNSALQSASADLTKYAQQGLVLSFDTMQSGYAPGQLVPVSMPWHDIDDQLLIESVAASDSKDGINIWYSVVAVLGPYDVTWSDFFSKLLATQQQIDAINVGSTQTANILQQFTASITLSAVLNTNVYSCPLPATTLFPSTTNFPC